jgi:hypothetical protein
MSAHGSTMIFSAVNKCITLLVLKISMAVLPTRRQERSAPEKVLCQATPIKLPSEDALLKCGRKIKKHLNACANIKRKIGSAPTFQYSRGSLWTNKKLYSWQGRTVHRPDPAGAYLRREKFFWSQSYGRDLRRHK